MCSQSSSNNRIVLTARGVNKLCCNNNTMLSNILSKQVISAHLSGGGVMCDFFCQEQCSRAFDRSSCSYVGNVLRAQEVTLFEIYIDTFMHIPQKNHGCGKKNAQKVCTKLTRNVQNLNSSNNKIKLNVDISNDQINIKTYTLYK